MWSMFALIWPMSGNNNIGWRYSISCWYVKALEALINYLEKRGTNTVFTTECDNL